MRISTLVQSKGSFVATIGADATVTDVVAELAGHGVGALVVFGPGNGYSGFGHVAYVVAVQSGAVQGFGGQQSPTIS